MFICRLRADSTYVVTALTRPNVTPFYLSAFLASTIVITRIFAHAFTGDKLRTNTFLANIFSNLPFKNVVDDRPELVSKVLWKENFDFERRYENFFKTRMNSLVEIL